MSEPIIWFHLRAHCYPTVTKNGHPSLFLTRQKGVYRYLPRWKSKVGERGHKWHGKKHMSRIGAWLRTTMT
jgi:hypothetical protein